MVQDYHGAKPDPEAGVLEGGHRTRGRGGDGDGRPQQGSGTYAHPIQSNPLYAVGIDLVGVVLPTFDLPFPHFVAARYVATAN